MTLTGKVAIVTCGKTGIGKACVLALAKDDADVVIDCVSDEAATKEQEVFLAGDGATYRTATTIIADGGMMLTSPGL
jgi:NAD(P)-dependent dehydrogenase (short-subunit alcohol dehydrogenase family)